jgi:methylated-DNA-[protein]-cysteine S-methyltransferase
VAVYAVEDTAAGPLVIAGCDGKLLAVKFAGGRGGAPSAVEELHRELRGGYDLVLDADAVRPLTLRVLDCLDGRCTPFDLDLDLSRLTPFQREVLLEVAKLPRGHVATYAEIAGRIGRPTAYRAVGNALGINPLPVVIPCHRVVGSDGIGGFGGGLDVKRALLAGEGVTIA